VPAQVDALLGAGDAREQRLGELLLRPDERENGPVMVDVGVHVEELGMVAQSRGEGVDGRPVASLGEVRDRFERQLHVPTLRPASHAIDHSRINAPSFQRKQFLGEGQLADRDTEVTPGTKWAKYRIQSAPGH